MRSMRISLLIAGSLLTGCSMRAPVSAPAPVPTPAPTRPAAPLTKGGEPGATEVTEAYGEIPDSVAGTWLMIVNSTTGNGRYLNGWRVYRIAHTGAQWQVNELVGDAPAELQTALDQASRDGVKFVPTRDMIHSVAATVSNLKQPPPRLRANRIVLRAPGHFQQGATGGPPPGTKLALEIVARGINVVIVGTAYYAREIQRDEITGESLLTSVSAAPGGGIVPVSLSGPFTMYRLD